MGRNPRTKRSSQRKHKKHLNFKQKEKQSAKSEPNRMLQWAHLPENIFKKILPHLSLEDLVALSSVSRWFRFCVKKILKCDSYTHRFRVEKTFTEQWSEDEHIQNFMRQALPAWPCVMFHIDIEESSPTFVHYALSEYLIPNLWIDISFHSNLYCQEIVQCPAIHSLTLHNIKGDFDLSKVSSTLRVLEISDSTLTSLLDCSKSGLTKVDLSYCNGAYIPPKLAVDTLHVKSCHDLCDLKNLGDVRVLFLYDCPSVINVSALSRVHMLTLSKCYRVTDVSTLGSVHTLNLSWCRVTDVSGLARVHDLNLTNCEQVVDVSGLSCVHTLNLSGCRSVTDVNALGNVHTLKLAGGWRFTDVSALSSVHTLNLSGHYYLADVSILSSVHNLDLSGCRQVEDVSALGSVHTLNLAECKSVTDVSALGNVHTLDLSYMKLTDVSALGHVHTLNLSECCLLKDVSALSSVHNLNLSGCHQVEDVSALGNVHTLNLFCWYSRVTDVSALGNVYNLNIGGCPVTDVSALGNVHTLDIRHTLVEDVSALSHVRWLCIMCTGVINVCALGFGIKIVISPCMKTHCFSDPGVIYQRGQNIYVNEGDTYKDTDTLCGVCFPKRDYDESE